MKTELFENDDVTVSLTLHRIRMFHCHLAFAHMQRKLVFFLCGKIFKLVTSECNLIGN